MNSGNTLWTELCLKYQLGNRSGKKNGGTSCNPILIRKDLKNKNCWQFSLKRRNGGKMPAFPYFQSFSKQAFPASVAGLYLHLTIMSLQFPYAEWQLSGNSILIM
jgi:hypothetical protein